MSGVTHGQTHKFKKRKKQKFLGNAGHFDDPASKMETTVSTRPTMTDQATMYVGFAFSAIGDTQFIVVNNRE